MPRRSGSIAGRIDRSVRLLPNQVQTLEAVLTPVSQRLARLDRLVLGQIADEVGHAAALDANDGLGRRAQSSLGGLDLRNIATPMTPARSDPAKIPTLAKSVRSGSRNARLVTKRDTVNPIPAIAARPKT